MKLQSCLLCDTVQYATNDKLLVLNSAADPFVEFALQQQDIGSITLAEDNVATLIPYKELLTTGRLRHVAFHNYILLAPAATMDVAVLNMLYQPAKTWLLYALELAHYALRPQGRLYVVGAKDRGVLSLAKHMQAVFGNLETLRISKGQRVLSAQRDNAPVRSGTLPPLQTFATDKTNATPTLDEGTQLLLESLNVLPDDEALDIGSGAGFVGLYIAQHATKGHVTMVDASLVAVDIASQAIKESGLTNICVLPGDSAQAVLDQRFDLVATNPPFHQGGIQTNEIAHRFIRDAAHVLQPQGRFYLVANRFLKYETVLSTHFGRIDEVGGNSRYKVYLAVQSRARV